MDEKLIVSIITTGQRRIGKTCLINLLNQDDDVNVETINFPDIIRWRPDFVQRTDPMEDGKLLLRRYWDTNVGCGRFVSLTSSYYRNANVLLLCFDVTNQESFYELRDTWLPEALQRRKEVAPLLSIIIVGLKSELLSQPQYSRGIDQHTISKLCQDTGNIEYYEVSTFQNINIISLRETIKTRGIASQLQKLHDNPPQPIPKPLNQPISRCNIC